MSPGTHDFPDCLGLTMELSLTLHAQQRCRERGISYLEICEAVECGREVTRDDKSRTVKLRRLCVVLNTRTGEVVTVFRQPSAKKKAKNQRQHKRKMALLDRHERKK